MFYGQFVWFIYKKKNQIITKKKLELKIWQTNKQNRIGKWNEKNYTFLKEIH